MGITDPGVGITELKGLEPPTSQALKSKNSCEAAGDEVKAPLGSPLVPLFSSLRKPLALAICFSPETQEGIEVLVEDLSKLLQGTADAAFAVNDQGLICAWNRAAEKLFGYPASEVVDKPCAPLFQGRSSLGTEICGEPCSQIECAVLNKEIPSYDVEVKLRSGRRLWVNVSIMAFRDERTNRHLVAHLMRNISRRKKAEELTQKLMWIAHQISALPMEISPPTPALSLTERERGWFCLWCSAGTKVK